MSKHYLTCPRCDKDLEINSMFDTFSSAIDFKIICKECWEKEQPKEMFKQIKLLEQKLAEKEKEIENVTIRHLNMLKYFIRHNSKQGIILSSDLEREIEEIERGEKNWQNKNFNQDKISFCIYQLELARRRIDHLRYNKNKCLNKKDCIEDCLEEIDNQIEELKKEMK